MPTFLDAAGAEIPPSVEGQSLLPLCTGKDTAWRSYIQGEQAFGEQSNHWVTDGSTKYIWYSQTGEEQLFDLSGDPHETVNLATNTVQEARLHEWRARLIQELEDREEEFVQDGKLMIGRKPVACLSHIL